MSDHSDFLIDGVIEREEATGATILFAGETYPCSGGPEFGGKSIEAGGFRMKAAVTIVLRTAVFGDEALPLEKQTLSYSSAAGVPLRRLRIESVTPWEGQMLVLECDDANRGA